MADSSAEGIDLPADGSNVNNHSHHVADKSSSVDMASNNHSTKPSADTTECEMRSESSPERHADLGAVATEPPDTDACNLGVMKKDDSGIAVEHSPACSSTDGDNSRMENDSGLAGVDPTSDLSTVLLADCADTEEDSQGNFRSSLHLDSDDSDDANTPANRKRRRSRTRSRSNSSTTTSSHVDEDHLEEPKSDTSSDAEDMEDESDPIKDRWHPLFELRKREIGSPNFIPAHMLFRNKTSSSLQFVQRLKLQTKLKRHDGCVNALHFNKSGTLLASGSDDLSVVLWDWMAGKPYLVYDSGHRSNVFQAKFMPYTGDCHVLSCARDGQVRLAELSSTGVCKSTKKLAQHRGAAHKLALLQDSSHEFYSCGEDAVVFEIDLRCEKPNKLCTTEENSKKVSLYSIHANPFRSHEFCVGGRDHFLRIYDKRMIDGGIPMKKYCPHHLLDSEVKANVTCAVYNYNGAEVLGTYNDEDIYLFDNYQSDGAEYIKRYQGHRNNATVKGVNFYGPKSEYVITGSDCSNVFIWDKETERIVQYFHGDEGGVINVLEPHPHSPILATSGLDHDVKIWSPTAEAATKLTGLKKTTRKNLKERDEERVNEPEMIDGQMLWFFMQQLRRTARRHGRTDGDELSVSSSNSDTESEHESESETRAAAMQCSQS